jgi:tetratricopeptide (TPR) repeat protein
MGNYKLSIDDYNKAIDIDPKLSEGYFRRGLSMFHSKRYKESIEDFN